VCDDPAIACGETVWRADCGREPYLRLFLWNRPSRTLEKFPPKAELADYKKRNINKVINCRLEEKKNNKVTQKLIDYSIKLHLKISLYKTSINISNNIVNVTT
jgi:hypothetical protein